MSTWTFSTQLDVTPEQIKNLLEEGAKLFVDAEELLDDPRLMVEVTVSTEDQGIGHYEYWGATGYDKQIVHTIESVTCYGIELKTNEEQDDILKNRINACQQCLFEEEPDYEPLDD